MAGEEGLESPVSQLELVEGYCEHCNELTALKVGGQEFIE
jgi:hypothetical protein